MLEWYRYVMDENKNPLRSLPRAQRFQLMLILSLMWTAIFCTGAGAWMWYGELVAMHVLLALGTLATGFTFRATARRAKSYRDHPAHDGTARYDDVWGA
ncbi:MAG: hypothetical protein HKN28_04845 [Alphaproteobacteria bacterium]|nr:hypothetical protein [Alphaproteobacteria bacterium]